MQIDRNTMRGFAAELQKEGMDPVPESVKTKLLLAAGAAGGVGSFVLGKRFLEDWKMGRQIRKQNAAYSGGGY